MTGDAKRVALDRIVALAASHNISADEIAEHLAYGDPRKEQSGALLGRILGYIGGALIFGGLVLFTGMQWDDLGRFGRVLLTFGAGIAAFIFGVITLRDARYEHAATPLFLSSAFLQPAGMLVFLREYANGNDTTLAFLIVFSLMAFQFLGAFFRLRRTSLLFCGYLFYNAALAYLFGRIGVSDHWTGIILGGSIMLVASAIGKGAHGTIASLWRVVGCLCYYGALVVFLRVLDMDGRWISAITGLSLLIVGFAFGHGNGQGIRRNVLAGVAHVLGSVAVLTAAFDLLAETPFDAGLLVLSVAMLFVSVKMRSRTLLTANTLGLFVVLGYYTSEYFSDVVGWPVALIVLGFLMVGISAAALRLGRHIRTTGQD